MGTSETVGTNVAGEGREMTFEESCSLLREKINHQCASLLALKVHKIFKAEQGYLNQHGEMQANIMLAFRHLEDARMRIGKILQAADDGVSILDKLPHVG